mgnify:CR=1 FL=1
MFLKSSTQKIPGLRSYAYPTLQKTSICQENKIKNRNFLKLIFSEKVTETLKRFPLNENITNIENAKENIPV